ncbi:hypothetical protein [Marinagarivorans algicola]|uniref:hypothetical protein n=1 Tax=Marinagarivorans algicola TaxID=1513270 RepID=UPI0006B5E3C0|nr:hypothetical protein [Marinagarivorans algicola]
MKDMILEIYALGVCFFTVACFMLLFGLILWDGIELSAPEFTINNYDYECHQSDEAYKECYETHHKYIRQDAPETFPVGQALSSARIKSYERVIQSERRRALQSLVQKLIILLINALIFLMHWRLAKNARKHNV